MLPSSAVLVQLQLLLKVRLNVFCGSWGTETSPRMLCLKAFSALKSTIQMDTFQDFPLLAGAAGAAATAEACQESS